MSQDPHASLAESTKRFALLAATLERNASEAAGAHQQSAQALQQTVVRTNQQIQATVDGAGGQLQLLLKQAVDQSFAPGTQQFEAAARSLIKDMQQAGNLARGQQAEVAAGLKRLLWKLHAVAIASTAILIIGGAVLVYYQAGLYGDARDRAKAAAIDAEIAEAMMKAKVTSCGGKPCVKLDTDSQRWGRKGEYVLLDSSQQKAGGGKHDN